MFAHTFIAPLLNFNIFNFRGSTEFASHRTSGASHHTNTTQRYIGENEPGPSHYTQDSGSQSNHNSSTPPRVAAAGGGGKHVIICHTKLRVMTSFVTHSKHSII